MPVLAIISIDYTRILHGITGQISETVCENPHILTLRHITLPRDIECGVTTTAATLQLNPVTAVGQAFHQDISVRTGYATCSHLDQFIIIVGFPHCIFAVRDGLAATRINSSSVQSSIVLHHIEESDAVTLQILVSNAITAVEIGTCRCQQVIAALHNRCYIGKCRVFHEITRIIHPHTPLHYRR